MLIAEVCYALDHPCILLCCHSWIDSNPEGVVHHKVGVLQITYLTIAFTRLAHLVECRVLDEVAGKEVTGLDFVFF